MQISQRNPHLRRHIPNVNFFKTGSQSMRAMFARRLDVGDSPGAQPRCQQTLTFGWYRPRCPHVFGHDKPTAGFQHTEGFSIKSRFFCCVAHTFASPHDIESVFGKRHFAKITLNKFRTAGDRRWVAEGVFFTVRNLARHDIEAGRLRLPVFGQPKTGIAQPATRIEHPFARLNLGKIGQHKVQIVERFGVAARALVVVAEVHSHILAAAVPDGAVVEARSIIIGVYVRVWRLHAGKIQENISEAIAVKSLFFQNAPFSSSTHTFIIMQKIAFFVFLAGLMFAQSSCAVWKQNRWLAEHNKTLKKLAESNIPAEQKLDGLVQDYVKFMNEGLNFVNPANSAKFVKKYHDQNDRYIDKILSDTQKWQGKLNTVEKVDLGLRIAQKPYLKDFVDLVPRFKKKYNQYAFIVKLTSKVAGGLTGLAGNALGL